MESIWTTGKRFFCKPTFDARVITNTLSRNSSIYDINCCRSLAPISTGKLVAREGERKGSTIPMPTLARWPTTTNSLVPVDTSQSSMVGQQRQQISELQFDRFPLHHHFYVGRSESETKWHVLIFHRKRCYGSKRWRWSIRGIEVVAISCG